MTAEMIRAAIIIYQFHRLDRMIVNAAVFHGNGQLIGSLFDEENYNRVRRADDGTEYHLVVVVRRGQPKSRLT